jgi:hypothetical protein
VILAAYQARSRETSRAAATAVGLAVITVAGALAFALFG